MRIDEVLQRIQGEFVEMPGLRLTPAQAQRLWGLEPDVCDALLGALVDAKFLAQTRDGGFRANGGRPSDDCQDNVTRPENGRRLSYTHRCRQADYLPRQLKMSARILAPGC